MEIIDDIGVGFLRDFSYLLVNMGNTNTSTDAPLVSSLLRRDSHEKYLRDDVTITRQVESRSLPFWPTITIVLLSFLLICHYIRKQTVNM